MRFLLALAAFCCLLQGSLAQAPDFGAKTQKEALAKMNFMIGTWKGSGWADAGGQRRTFDSSEIIIPKCDGTLLSLEGLHSMTVDGKQIPVHNAFGTIRYDEKAKKYLMHAHLANGLDNEYEFKPLPNGYTWSQASPNWGNVVYTAEFSQENWIEYGEIEKDGKKVRVYEMKLSKVKS